MNEGIFFRDEKKYACRILELMKKHDREEGLY
jgi:hypothetical protein